MQIFFELAAVFASTQFNGGIRISFANILNRYVCRVRRKKNISLPYFKKDLI